VTAVTRGPLARSYTNVVFFGTRQRAATLWSSEVFMQAISNLGFAAKFGLLITAAPMVLGLAFAARPKEHWLALMRPLTLASLFATIANVFLGVTNSFVWAARNAVATPTDVRLLHGLAEVAVVGFLSFAFLTIGWLAVAAGMRRLSYPTA
jgi:hypothetical protein